MRRFSPKLTIAVLLGCAVALGIAGQASAATPKRGGTLNFVVGSKIPSYDLHKETTFGVIHPIAPFYSLLIRINPEDDAEGSFLMQRGIRQNSEKTRRRRAL